MTTYPLTSVGTCDHCGADETSMNPDGTLYCHLCYRLSGDEEILRPEWMEEDIYRDRDEEAYNEMLMDGGDL